MDGKKTDSKLADKMDELLQTETFKRMIECPICLELPLPPVYTCASGHIICNCCRGKTLRCPVCRMDYSRVRNFLAEGILEHCIMSCKYEDQGCHQSLRGAEMAEHLKSCDYRLVSCNECNGRLINYNEYENHLLGHHRIDLLAVSYHEGVYSYNKHIKFVQPFADAFQHKLYMKALAYDNASFLLNLYTKDSCIGAWVSMLAPASECAKYNVYIECSKTNDDSAVHVWEGPVNHFRTNITEGIHRQGKGLLLPATTPFDWRYYVEISPINLIQHKSSSTEAQFMHSPNQVTIAGPRSPAFIVIPGVAFEPRRPPT